MYSRILVAIDGGEDGSDVSDAERAAWGAAGCHESKSA